MTLPLAGARVKASDLLAIFPQNTGTWTNYTPALTQSAVVTKTVEYCRYTQVGKLVMVEFSLAPTSSGTAANPIVVGFPPSLSPTAFRILGGDGGVFDASASTWYMGAPIVSGAGFAFQGSGVAAPIGQSLMTAAVTTSDVVAGALWFMTA